MMSRKDCDKSITVNVSRPKTFAKASVIDIRKKNLKKKVFDKVITKPSEGTLHLYSLPGNQPLRSSVLKADVSLLPYRYFVKKQEQNKHKLRITIKLQEKYKIINTDLRNRLHIQDRPNDIKALTDIDNSYFQYLDKGSGSPKQYIPMFKSLKFEYHERLRMKQEIGYKRDCILKIEQNYRQEQENYRQSVEKYMDQVKQLDAFVAADYQRSMAYLKKCDAITKKLEGKIVLTKILATQQFTIQSRLIGLDYLYCVQQKYGRFLYYLSPPSWRAKHREFAHSVEIEAKGFDLGFSSEEDTFNVIFQKMQNECYSGLIKPVLYFTHPDVLMSMFDRIEKQHLHHFIHVVPLGPRTNHLKEVVGQLKRRIQKDTALVAHLIEDFVKHVHFCEEREAQLQAKFMKILHGLFYDTVAATDVLKLKMYLEFHYEEVFREESFNMNTMLTAKALESMYMDYSFKLEAFTNDKVKAAMKRNIEKEAKKMRDAHMAATELRRFDMLEHSMLRAHEKNCKVTVTANNMRNLHTVHKTKRHRQSVKPISRAPQYSLTTSEVEYLYLFTDWTENEDPGKYLHSLSISDRKNSLSK